MPARERERDHTYRCTGRANLLYNYMCSSIFIEPLIIVQKPIKVGASEPSQAGNIIVKLAAVERSQIKIWI